MNLLAGRRNLQVGVIAGLIYTLYWGSGFIVSISQYYVEDGKTFNEPLGN